jgi:hypothetical protein
MIPPPVGAAVISATSNWRHSVRCHPGRAPLINSAFLRQTPKTIDAASKPALLAGWRPTKGSHFIPSVIHDLDSQMLFWTFKLQSSSPPMIPDSRGRVHARNLSKLSPAFMISIVFPVLKAVCFPLLSVNNSKGLKVNHNHNHNPPDHPDYRRV